MGVEIVTIGKGRKVATQRVKEKATRILKLLNQNRAELSLALVGNREIRQLNKRFRKKNEPTDVLSFPLGGSLPTRKRLLGDVVISVERAERQARESRKNLEAEIDTLLIHGILHLLGYDHGRSAKEARRMQRTEKRVHQALCEPKASRV
ncbi:MAG: rRNA maturation RNase YbeY [Candidatus Binatia bacterium]